MTKTKVEIGIACAPNQTPGWWTKVMAELLAETNDRQIEVTSINTGSSSLPDWNKNTAVYEKRRGSLTDANRVNVCQGFLAGKAEYIWWLDDDTVPPLGALSMLLDLKREFVAGLYFNPKTPYNPIAYLRAENGLYAPLWNYPRGTLTQVDSVGMGCTLIHRSVYEKIQEEHVVYQRPNGSIFPVHKTQVQNKRKRATGAGYVKDGAYHLPVIEVDMLAENETRVFPFYAFEYGRTEDHHFCELAGRVGYRPWLDTTLTCEHIKPLAVGVKDYERALAEGVHP